MNYELAKELKDAGFPQQRTIAGTYLNQDGSSSIVESTYKPTLSELIEACGEYFECLGRQNYPKGNIFFQAYPTEEAFERMGKGCVVDCCGYESGSTPEEAVARLWLALNKK